MSAEGKVESSTTTSSSSSSTTTAVFTKEKALDTLLSHARSTVSVAMANSILQPFGYTAEKLGLVYHAEAGVDTNRTIHYQTGDHVDVTNIARALSQLLNAPDVDYDTDYSGAGKSAEAWTHKYVLQIRKALTTESLNTSSPATIPASAN